MTKRKKLALLKKSVRMLEPVLKEEAALVPLERVGEKSLRKKAMDGAAKMIPVEKLKRYGLLGGGALLGLSLLGSAARTESVRLALSRELKRQLKPIQEKLDLLEKENAALQAKLERHIQRPI